MRFNREIQNGVYFNYNESSSDNSSNMIDQGGKKL